MKIMIPPFLVLAMLFVQEGAVYADSNVEIGTTKVENCTIFNDTNLNAFFPCANYNSKTYRADIKFNTELFKNTGRYSWTLASAIEIPSKKDSNGYCADVDNALNIDISCGIYQNKNYLAKLSYINSNDSWELASAEEIISIENEVYNIISTEDHSIPYIVRAVKNDAYIGLLYDENNQNINGAVFYKKGSERIELSFDPSSGLLYDLSIADEYYMFSNYTGSTVDIISISLSGEIIVIPNVPLSSESSNFINEMASTGIVPKSSHDRDNSGREAEWANKGLKIALDALQKAKNRGSYKVSNLALDVIKKQINYYHNEIVYGKETMYTLALLKAISTKFSCTVLNPWACIKYYANKDKNDQIIDDFIVSVKDVMIKVNQNISKGHELSVAGRVGCDEFYQFQPEKRNECIVKWGSASQGKNDAVIDDDRDNNGVDDRFDEDNGCKSCSDLLAHFQQENEENEDNGCNGSFPAKDLFTYKCHTNSNNDIVAEQYMSGQEWPTGKMVLRNGKVWSFSDYLCGKSHFECTISFSHYHQRRLEYNEKYEVVAKVSQTRLFSYEIYEDEDSHFQTYALKGGLNYSHFPDFDMKEILNDAEIYEHRTSDFYPSARFIDNQAEESFTYKESWKGMAPNCRDDKKQVSYYPKDKLYTTCIDKSKGRAESYIEGNRGYTIPNWQ